MTKPFVWKKDAHVYEELSFTVLYLLLYFFLPHFYTKQFAEARRCVHVCVWEESHPKAGVNSRFPTCVFTEKLAL